MREHVILSGILASIAYLFFHAFFPHIKLICFAPFLAVLFIQMKATVALWISALTGVFVDLFSSHFFGMYALVFVLACIFLYRQKRFFALNPLNLAIYTAIISVVITLIEPVLLFLFEKKVTLSWKWFFTDLIIMPTLDGLFAIIWFAYPIKLYDMVKKQIIRLQAK